MKSYLPSIRYSVFMLVGGVLGLAASAALTIEKIFLLEDPNYKLSCSLNEIFACGSVVTTEQASVFGFANSIVGVILFPVLITLGLIGISRNSLPNYFKYGLFLGLTFGHLFVLWLAYQSLYVIGALCPWCMVVWAVTVPLSLLSIAEVWPEKRNLSVIANLAIFGWFAILFALIFVRFYI